MERITEAEAKFYRKLNPKVDFMYNMKQATAFTLTKDEEGWDNVTYYGEPWIDPTECVYKPHYVYVLVNASLPGVCKIGYTTKTVYERCRQINAATGVITPWYPVFAYKCPNGRMLEAEVHQYLENRGKRISINKEGFEIDSSEAVKVIENLGKKYQNSTEND